MIFKSFMQLMQLVFAIVLHLNFIKITFLLLTQS